jgi:hypothetical protein
MPFGKGSSIAIRFNSLLIFMVSLRTFSLFLQDHATPLFLLTQTRF